MRLIKAIKKIKKSKRAIPTHQMGHPNIICIYIIPMSKHTRFIIEVI